MADFQQIKDQYPFSEAKAGEHIWLSGGALVAMGEVVQSCMPHPDPNVYDQISRLSDGVHFGLTVPPEDVSYSSSSSSSSSSSVGSISKTAIVPVDNGFLKWHCEERPDVIFRDCVVVPVTSRGRADLVVPDAFLQSVATDTLRVSSVVPCGGRAGVIVSRSESGWTFEVKESWWRSLFGRRRVAELVVSFEAVRLGFEGVRYAFATKEEYEANERFYNLQRHGVDKSPAPDDSPTPEK